MRSALAEKLLVKIMEWTPEEISKERPLLQAMANFKYDEYQQFSPGTRFIESLVKWLSQFSSIEEKRTAYNFIKDHLIFISNDQINHLVNITFSEKINPIIIGKTAEAIGISNFLVRKISKSRHYRTFLRRSLFIGLSDGSKIDQLRRSYNRISNEQVLSTYSVSKEKVEDMILELRNSSISTKFNTIFLIDDFTASGTSYFRKRDNKWGGKIYKFITSIFDESIGISNLIEDDELLDVHVIFYIATEDAIGNLETSLKQFKNEHAYLNFKFTIQAVQILGTDIKNEILTNKSFIELAEFYYDDEINDSHYKMGKHDFPYLGFNECSLPLVLNHNTPNNSLPILWFSDDRKYKGLFPRVTRHKDE